MVSPDDPRGDSTRDPGARRGRGSTWAVVLIMTLLAALGAPLAAFVLGGPDAATSTQPSGPPALESPGTEPSEPADSAEGLGEPAPEPDFVLATFNVLGHSHTTETGKEPDLDGGPRRLRRALRLLNEAKADVVGLQELQRPQALAFEDLAGDKWRLFHDVDDSENSIAWRRTQWSAVSTRTVGVPYFNGNERRMPVVHLRHRRTGAKVWFINVHNPANTGRFPGQEDHRAKAVEVELELAERLARGKSSVVLMGDLNQRAEAFCYFTRSGTLVSGTGESREKGGTADCQDPAYNGIDWIFGTPDLQFSEWSVRDDDRVGITSDHPLVTVSVGLPR